MSTVFSVSRVQHKLPPPPGSLYQSRPNDRLFVSVLMYSICFESCTSSLLHSGPFRDISGSQLTYGEDCRNMLEAARLWTPIPQMCRYILSSNRLCHCVRNTESFGGMREAFQNAFLTSRFPPQAIFCLREPVWESLGTSDVDVCTLQRCSYSYAIYLGEPKQVWDVFILQYLHLM